METTKTQDPETKIRNEEQLTITRARTNDVPHPCMAIETARSAVAEGGVRRP